MRKQRKKSYAKYKCANCGGPVSKVTYGRFSQNPLVVFKHVGNQWTKPSCANVMAVPIRNKTMKDIEGMSVQMHHKLCVGVLGLLYKQVDSESKQIIWQAVKSAQQMGMDCNPDNLELGKALSENPNN